jgi:hypothetical protein
MSHNPTGLHGLLQGQLYLFFLKKIHIKLQTYNLAGRMPNTYHKDLFIDVFIF